MPETKRELEKTSGAARILHLSEARVRQLEAEGKLPCQRTADGMRLFVREDLDRFIREREERRRV